MSGSGTEEEDIAFAGACFDPPSIPSEAARVATHPSCKSFEHSRALAEECVGNQRGSEVEQNSRKTRHRGIFRHDRGGRSWRGRFYNHAEPEKGRFRIVGIKEESFFQKFLI